MQIAGLLKNSTVDFPGYFSAVIFLPGCNYDCFYCHNRLLLHDPPIILQANVMEFLQKRQGLIDGVVISGGEPTLHKDLPRFISTIKEMGYKIKLDTNGSNPIMVENLIKLELIDYIAMDYKAPFDMYQQIAGYDFRGVRQTLEILISSGIEYELRTTMVPQITHEKLEQMAREVPLLKKFVLQLYRPQEGFEKFHSKEDIYTPNQLIKLSEKIKDFQPNIEVRA